MEVVLAQNEAAVTYTREQYSIKTVHGLIFSQCEINKNMFSCSCFNLESQILTYSTISSV